MFLIDRHSPGGAARCDGSAEEFVVLGATGNVYTVTICKRPHCSCPDHAKRNSLCKHILFVMLRVLRVAQTDPVLWQHALLTSEVERVLRAGAEAGAGDDGEDGDDDSNGLGAPEDVLASTRVRSAYRAAIGQPGGAERDARRRPVEGDCAICFEALIQGAEPLSWCLTCGNSCHSACFGQWESSKRGRGQAVACALCRAPWQDGSKPAPAVNSNVGGLPVDAVSDVTYLNLASEEARLGDTSLTQLYGGTAGFIEHHQGLRGIRSALRMAL